MMMFSLILVFVCLTSVFTLQEDCYHRGVKYVHGEQFMDECNHCYCSNGAVACTLMGCNVHPLSRRNSELQLPDLCLFNGNVYNVGDSFMDADDCNTCGCVGLENGETATFCTLKACINLNDIPAS